MDVTGEGGSLLLRAEQETLRALDAALLRVEDATVVDELRVFRREHASHVDALAQALESAPPVPETSETPLSDEVLRAIHASSPAESLGALAAAESASAGLFAKAAASSEGGSPIAVLLERLSRDHERNAAVLRRAAESAEGGGAPPPPSPRVTLR